MVNFMYSVIPNGICLHCASQVALFYLTSSPKENMHCELGEMELNNTHYNYSKP